MDSSRFARKRLKPAVSLAAVHRRPKDENQPPRDDGKASETSPPAAAVAVVQQPADVKLAEEEENNKKKEEDAVAAKCSESDKQGQKVAAAPQPFRSRFIRPKPRLDLVQRSKQAEEESAKNVKAVGAEQCGKSVTVVTAAKTQQEAVVVRTPEPEGGQVVDATPPTTPQKGPPPTSRDNGGSAQDGKAANVEGRHSPSPSPVREKEQPSPAKAPVRKRVRRWKMSEIKKNLEVKLENGKPNRSRLTMFDLIYYNPTSNPMKHPEASEGTRPGPEESVSSLNEDRLQEESVDEPSSAGAELEDEEEEAVAMPVPQVKVGPDGQIIIDEQSLVIETTGTQKGREDLRNSSVVMDYGNGSATYNAYSKRAKMKTREWSKEDTLKFYRALQNIGTDFLLMQTFFPKLTRKEIKAKFKKEEKVNKELIDKALQNPLKFNISELEEEFAKMEELNKEKPVAKPKVPRKPRSDTFFKSLDETEKRKRGRPPKKATNKRLEKKKNPTPEVEAAYRWNYDDLRLDPGLRKEGEEEEEESSPAPKAKRAKLLPSDGLRKEGEEEESSPAPKAKRAKLLPSDDGGGSPPGAAAGGRRQPTRSGRIPQPKVMEDFTSLPDEDEDEEEAEGAASMPPPTPPAKVARSPAESARGRGRPGRRPRRMPVGRPPRARKVLDDYGPTVAAEEEEEAEPQETEVETGGGGEDEVILEVDADVVEESVVLSAETSDFTQTLGNLGSLYSNVPPGAVVVLATESPDNPGRQVYKVFMVSGNNGVLPVSLGGGDEGGGGNGGEAERLLLGP